MTPAVKAYRKSHTTLWCVHLVNTIIPTWHEGTRGGGPSATGNTGEHSIYSALQPNSRTEIPHGTAKTQHDVLSVWRKTACPCSESIIHIVSCVWRTGEEKVNKREQAWLNCSLAFGILQVQRNVSIKWNIGKWNEVSLETGRETES